MVIPDVSKFSDEELAAFLDTFDTILTDCDGVLWILGDPLDGAADAVGALEALGKRVFYVSNNATRSIAQYVAGFSALGYKLTESQVVTTATSVAHVLHDKGIVDNVHVLGSSSFKRDLEATGVRCTQPSSHIVQTVSDLKKAVRTVNRDAKAVVVDYTPTVNYMQLQEASILLQNPECLFISGASDLAIPFSDNVTLIGPGYIVDLLSAVSEREPLRAGKPSAVIKDVVAARHPTMDPSRTLFIGDTLSQDVQQGILCGFITLLVLTGCASHEEAENAPPVQQPQFVAPSLKSLVPALQRLVSAAHNSNDKK